LFFVFFNVLEALQPSLVSRAAPPHLKGLALGLYNTAQAFGLFFGGVLGGWVSQHQGVQAVFWGLTAVSAVWLIATWGLHVNMPERSKPMAEPSIVP
jgi:MFS family permease